MKERQKLAQKLQKEKAAEAKTEVCDNCAHGKWNTNFFNLDLNGKPITLRCPYYEDGKYGILRGTAACEKFLKKD